MLTASELMVLAREAPQDLKCWSSFVAQTEFVWQHSALVTDCEGWQAIWFEMEIVNGLALAEWEEEGFPQDWSQRWHEGYEQDARELVPELIALIICPESSE
ncbi:hypothetical protein [Pseudomonas palleroniana]|uniref:Uncharacterized protein n=1 Tax=Pseudomonas palleroniana TaxID=191390 RepID=A0A0X7JXZ2_9PSED|nr:hypothetical protein [Pseudomonas palleroniana]KWU48309.1 hypothetical protein AWV77_25515 [Pseudomonas palleroniana]